MARATLAAPENNPTPPDQLAAADPSGYTAAPMPDTDQSGPAVVAPEPGQAQWSPSLFTGQSTYRGEGFVPGSTVQGAQRRSVSPAPGVSLNVPLQ